MLRTSLWGSNIWQASSHGCSKRTYPALPDPDLGLAYGAADGAGDEEHSG